jgi:hypothetical protein
MPPLETSCITGGGTSLPMGSGPPTSESLRSAIISMTWICSSRRRKGRLSKDNDNQCSQWPTSADVSLPEAKQLPKSATATKKTNRRLALSALDCDRWSCPPCPATFAVSVTLQRVDAGIRQSAQVRPARGTYRLGAHRALACGAFALRVSPACSAAPLSRRCPHRRSPPSAVGPPRRALAGTRLLQASATASYQSVGKHI